MTQDEMKKILSDPSFKRLTSARARLRWGLSLVALVMFFGFIALISTARGALGASIPGSAIPVGFGLAFTMIVSVVVLTAIYLQQSSTRFDPLVQELTREGQP
jgi:uncharacterized membrane protein (DUF485 family)